VTGNHATDFLGQISTREQQALLRIAKRRLFQRGEFVFRVGDVTQAAYILLHGRLKFFRLTATGREVILWFCFPGEIFGLTEVPSGKGRRINVQACDESEVAIVPDASFGRFLDCHADAARMCRRTMTARLGILANTLVNVVADDASHRVAKLVLHMGLQHGERRHGSIDLGVPLSHQEIANMAGVNRQTVTRVLGHLSKRGILTIARRSIRIDSERMLNDFIHTG